MPHCSQLGARFRFAFLAVGLLLAAGPARADTYSWDLTGGGDWNSGANWDSNTAAPVNAGDVAILGNMIAANSTLTFSNFATVGEIQFTDLTGTKAYTVGTGSFSFTMNNGASQPVIRSTSTVSSTGVQLIRDGVNVSGASGLLADIQGGTVQLSGTLSASGLTKTGSGTFHLSGGNQTSLVGPIAVNGGVLRASGLATLGPTTNSITVTAGGQLFYNPSGFERFRHNIHIAGHGPSAPAGQPYGALRFDPGFSSTYTGGDVILDADATIWLRGTFLFRDNAAKGLYIGTHTVTLAGQTFSASGLEGQGIRGTTGGVIVDIPSGSVGIDANGTYTGPTTINRGTVFLTAAEGLGQSLGTVGNAVTVNPGGKLYLNGGSFDVGNKRLVLNGGGLHSNGNAKSWAGAVNLVAPSTIHAEGGASVLTLTGGIDNAGHTLTLQPYFNDSVIHVNSVGISGAGKVIVEPVTGNGTIHLNATGTYTGGTDVNAHKVYVNATSGTGTGPVTVNKPSQFSVGGQLSGTGSVAGPVAVNGGILAPGAPTSPGTLTLNNGVTFGTSPNGERATFRVRVPSVASFDKLVVDGGTANLGNATLTVDFTGLSGPIDPATRLYVLQTTGPGMLQPSTFNGLPNGAWVGNAAGTDWGVFYEYGTNGGVYLTPVPEPGTVLGAAAVGLVGIGLVRRRRGGRQVG